MKTGEDNFDFAVGIPVGTERLFVSNCCDCVFSSYELGVIPDTSPNICTHPVLHPEPLEGDFINGVPGWCPLKKFPVAIVYSESNSTEYTEDTQAFVCPECRKLVTEGECCLKEERN